MNAITFSEKGVNWAQTFSSSPDAARFTKIKNYTIQKALHSVMLLVALVELVFFSALKIVKTFFRLLDESSNKALAKRIDSAKSVFKKSNYHVKSEQIQGRPEKAKSFGQKALDSVMEYRQLILGFIIGASSVYAIWSMSDYKDLYFQFRKKYEQEYALNNKFIEILLKCCPNYRL